MNVRNSAAETNSDELTNDPIPCSTSSACVVAIFRASTACSVTWRSRRSTRSESIPRLNTNPPRSTTAASTEGTATFQRRPSHTSRLSGRSMRTRGANTTTPAASPDHQVVQPNAASVGGITPVMSWAATPNVALTTQATGPASDRNARIWPGLSSGRSRPTNRCTSALPASACRAAPRAMTAAVTISAVDDTSPRWIVVAFTTKDPTATPTAR